MAQSDNKRFYWIKLKEDFFKRHDIKIIESMPSGKDYVIFYLKLLCESISHEGALRFSDEIPYDEEMLSIVTDTDILIVKQALMVLKKFNLIEILDDGTYYLSKVEKLIGSETGSAQRKREYREVKRIGGDTQGTTMGQCPQEIDIDKDIDIDIEKKKDYIKKKQVFQPPTLEQVQEYCAERNNNVDYQRWYNFYESKGWMVGKNKMKDWKASVRTWERTTTNPDKTLEDYWARMKRGETDGF